MSTIAQTEPMCLMCEEFRRTFDETLLNPISDRMQELGITNLLINPVRIPDSAYHEQWFGLSLKSDHGVGSSGLLAATWFDRLGRSDIMMDRLCRSFCSSIFLWGEMSSTLYSPTLEGFTQSRPEWTNPVSMTWLGFLRVRVAIPTPNLMSCNFDDLYMGPINPPSRDNFDISMRRLNGVIIPNLGIGTMIVNIQSRSHDTDVRSLHAVFLPDSLQPHADGFVEYIMADPGCMFRTVPDTLVTTHPITLRP